MCSIRVRLADVAPVGSVRLARHFGAGEPLSVSVMSHHEFAILGAGAMGSILGAHLARAGHSVALLARGRRAAQIRAEGLRIGGLVQFSTPITVIDDPTQLREADTLIVATKAIDTAASLAPLSRARIGKALSVQNGVMKNDLLAAAFGWDRVLGALANMSGEVLPSGEVLFTRNVNVLIGDLAGGVSNATQKIAQTIDAARCGLRLCLISPVRSGRSSPAGWGWWVCRLRLARLRGSF